MYDKKLIVEILQNIAWSLDQIVKRFQTIESSDDFLKDDLGLEKLDSICMQLINIGEALKQIDKLTDAKLFINYPDVDWKKAKGMRDIITHHYFDIDAETVYVVCSERIPDMREVIKKILKDLENNKYNRS
ncbi:MAG: antitoxin [Flavobacteria bacterium RIFCSPLOWO2_12_FULL_35_11]|nr:MAG: antitoxin [Bdellovibrionales bacterium RIFOXYB2_FULL_36_6]OGS72947.1 MAG: antitoxin [Flavobacteria bacterium RIFCSPLOWO2_12_FULL_35_11]